MGTEAAITANAVFKTFDVGFASQRRFEALRGVSLSVRAGTSFGFLGPNGAGKTTTIKILTGLIFPTRGEIQVLGGSPSDPRCRARMGYLPENPSFPDHLTGAEIVGFSAELLGMKRAQLRPEIDRVLGVVDLKRAADVPVRKYSKGMTQRLGIAQALLKDPALVILDEPMSGLDPVGRRDIKDLITRLRAEGRTVFFSTHIIADVEEICDEIAMVSRGLIVKQGAVSELVGTSVKETEIVTGPLPAGFPGAEPGPGQSTVIRLKDEAQVRPTIERIWQSGGRVISVRVSHYGLEDLFMDELKKGPLPAQAGDRA
jgi:ABC-2 type transport system ATP-binding protein